MKKNLNTVKIQAVADSTYHHGDLRVALVSAAEAILAERGVTGFSLREAARRTGVSPAAPSHHFGDSRGLLTAVAAKGFRKLTDQLNSALQKATKRARLEAVGEAYLEFAKRNPALFTIMWTRDLLDQSDPDYLAAGRAAFNVLERAATGEEIRVATAPHRPSSSVVAAWAMLHGLARLTLDGALDNAGPELASEVIELMPKIAGR
jgi:AcrR family transcriptional regulator